MMEKVPGLRRGVLPDAFDALHKYQNIVCAVEARVEYILHFVLNEVGGKLDWWAWNCSCEDNPMGNFEDSFHENAWTFHIDFVCKKEPKMKFVDRLGKEVNLEWGDFPIEWLYEDFEEEFKEGLVKYAKLKEEKAKKAKENKISKAEEKRQLKASAAAKLTPEERKVLGLK